MAFAEAGQNQNQNKKLRWERLTRNLCPGCSARTILGSKNGLIVCPINCGFKIRPEKMQEIVLNILEDNGRDDEWEEWQTLCNGCGKPDLICSCYD